MLSYALCHNPYKYNLEVDGGGWTSINKLLIALSSDYYNNDNRMSDHIITRQDIEIMIASSDKVRFELKHEKIRALYGHSNLVTKINKIPGSMPPAILYHGTAPTAIKNIMSEGLRPMNRQYVHLSTDENTAIRVGKRKINHYKKEQPVIISVFAIEAYNTGAYHFYQTTDLVWLTDYIHPNCMEIKNT